MRARRMGPAPAQAQYQREAAENRAQFATVNGGRPALAARPVATRDAAAAGERGGVEPFSKGAPAVNARPEPRGSFSARGGAPPVNAKPEPNQPAQRAMASRQNPAVARGAQQAPRPGLEPNNRSAVAARPPIREQRPSPFRNSVGRPSAPQHQEHSADRRMPESKPQAPAGRPPEARPAQHQAPEAKPPVSQSKSGLAGQPEPQRQDRDKHSK
jgi:hypothetical protein